MRSRAVFLTLVVALGAAVWAWGDDAPDSQINPQTLAIETVSAVWSGSNYNGRFTIDPGNGQPTVSVLFTAHAADDLAPRLDITSSGDTWITWYRDLSVDQVRVRKFKFATQSWGTDRLLGNSAESGRNPEIAFDGSHPWIAYEIAGASSRSIAVGVIADEPDPITARTVLGSTSYSGEVDVQIHAETGHLWVTWVDSDTQVAWSEYETSSQSWTTVAVESYSGTTVAAARALIRDEVLGN